VRNVSNSLEDVENLLGTLVDISKLDAGVIKADIAPFALSELMDNLAAEYAQVARSEGLELHFVGCSAVVRSDIQLLARILRNLLSNAIRYTHSGRVVLGVGACVVACGSGVGQRHRHCRRAPGRHVPGVQAR
jgi:signal transduction histidine kinase